jgi:hypothetical protein
MRNPNQRDLAMRDPALAALMGIHNGSDFGADFGQESGDGFGWGYAPGQFGQEGAIPSQAMARPAPPMMQQHPAFHPSNAGRAAELWDREHSRRWSRDRREYLLDPNKGSDIKVERYSFGLNQQLTLATTVGLDLTNQPDTTIRPQRVLMNAPSPGFCSITEIKVANVSVFVGVAEDAYFYSALAVGVHLDMPTLTPANRATVLGTYSGAVPAGFTGGSSFLFCAAFQGPATIAG